MLDQEGVAVDVEDEAGKENDVDVWEGISKRGLEVDVDPLEVGVAEVELDDDNEDDDEVEDEDEDEEGA